MFGADTPLAMDALQMAAAIAAAAAGTVYLVMRRRKTGVGNTAVSSPGKTNLEERVEVLERIATDRSIDLAEEIEALRKPAAKENAQ